MTSRRLKQQGFTLVEILIVVVILGILAAIVIPQFTSASETAKASSLVTQLQSIRSQLELYQLQHNGSYPDAAQMAGFANLISPTDVDGAIQAVGTAGAFGPYMQAAPGNPFTAAANATTLAIGSDPAGAMPAATSAVGWVYNTLTGEIRASLPLLKAQETNISHDGADSDANTY